VAHTPPGETRARVLAFVRERILEGRPPTTREVQQRFGFKAVQSARQHLEALVAAGRLAKEPGRSRGYRLPGGAGGGAPQLVPILGRVHAGDLSEAIESSEGYLPVDGHLAGEILFALRVEGESMTGAGILPGDVVVVRRQERAPSGAIVVALVRDEATVKRLRIRGRRFELHPENPDFAPIVPEPGVEVRILGQVVEVRRRLE
jgi:repressor LexA